MPPVKNIENLVDLVPGMQWDGKKIVVNPDNGQTGNKKVLRAEIVLVVGQT